MAISTNTFKINAGWARTEVIGQLEQAFAWAGAHGAGVSGVITSISAYSGGGDVGSASTDYYSVEQSATNGSGKGASFHVDRQSGEVNNVYVNKPGSGYATGNTITLPAEKIGEAVNGASNLTVTVNVSPTTYGSTSHFFDKDVTTGQNNPWGVLREEIGAGKSYGSTYRSFQMYSATYIQCKTGSSFYPYDEDSSDDKSGRDGNRFAGETNLDVPYTTAPIWSSDHQLKASNRQSNCYSGESYQYQIANSNSYDLDLTVFKSGLDSKFRVYSFRQPTLAAAKLRDNTFFTFFTHNYTPQHWDLDYLFQAGWTQIKPNTSDSLPFLEFLSGLTDNRHGNYPAKRAAEFGYCPYDGYDSNYSLRKTKYWGASVDEDASYFESVIPYYRENVTDYNNPGRGKGGYQDGKAPGETLNDATNYNAIIKGIPINVTMVPCPYYLPDDFGIVTVDYATPSANIQQGDTITVSGSEVWTVITGSYNQDTRTRGILFVARTT